MKIKHILLVAAAITGFVSCDDAKYKYDDVTGPGRVFLNESTGTSKSKIFVIPDNGMTVTVTPRISKPLDRDLEVTVYVNEEMLAAYNKRYKTSFELLPEINYSFEAKTVIPAGKVVSKPVAVDLSALTTEQNKSGFSFALPLAVKATDGSMKSIESFANYMYVANPVPYSDVPGVTRGSVIHLQFKDDQEYYELPSWTFETMFHASRLNTSSYVSWLASAISRRGDNGNRTTNSGFMLRLGDTGLGGNIINGQVSANGSRNVSDKPLAQDQWFHIALVNDNKAITLYVNGEKAFTCTANPSFDSKFMPHQGIRLGGESRSATQHVADGTYYHYSQVRMWTVARTQDQIKNNVYGVPADSEGLLGYWKLNEYTEGVATVYKSDTEINSADAPGVETIQINTYFFKDATGKNPDGYIDYGPTITTAAKALNFTTDRRIELGYNWAGVPAN